jgi:superfamily II DNA or RNA helicase
MSFTPDENIKFKKDLAALHKIRTDAIEKIMKELEIREETEIPLTFEERYELSQEFVENSPLNEKLKLKIKKLMEKRAAERIKRQDKAEKKKLKTEKRSKKKVVKLNADAKPKTLKAKTTKTKKKRLTKKDKELLRVKQLPDKKVGLPSDVSSKSLQKHQLEFAKNLIDGDLKGAIAIHGVGTGKTLTAVISAEMFLNKNPKSKVYVITPASLLSGFKDELYTYDPAIEKDTRYHFFTYDGYSNAVKRGESSVDCTDALLIVDEAQNLRTKISYSENSKFDTVTKTLTVREHIKSGGKVLNILRECALKAKKILLLSATPLVNSYQDLENLMAMINGHMPLDTKGAVYRQIFESPIAIKKYFGCRLSFFENSKESRAKFFPKMAERFVPLVMNNQMLKEYISVERANLGKISSKVIDELNINMASKNINAFYAAVRRASNGLDGEFSQKVNYMIEWIKGVLAKKPDKSIDLTKKIIDTHTDKTVIFTHFLNAGSRLIIKRLVSEKIPFGVINGSVSKTNRAKIVEQYVKGDIKVILISKAGAEGLNLLETGFIFLMEPSWNNAEQSQVKGRGVRFKSHINLPEAKQNVLVISLFLIKPSEEKTFQKVIKGDMKAFMEGDRSNSAESIDLFLYVKSNQKQNEIDVALNKLRDIDPLENCTYPKSFLDITNLFKVERQNPLPALSAWEKKFYSTIIKGDSPKLPKAEPDDFSMPQLKHKMTDLTRRVFSGNKALVQAQNAFFTPPEIADDLVKLSGINTAESDIVFLEPSAGSGYIIFEALASNKKVYCEAVENLKPLRKFLEEFPRTDILPQDNFFDVPITKKYRVILMNPPFKLAKGKGLKSRVSHDVDFVMRAWEMLEDDAILVCLISNKFTFRGKDSSRKADKKIFEPFRNLLKENEHKIIEYKDGFTKKGGATLKEMETGVQMRMVKILKKSKK